jgi:hypothetical protein
MFDDKNVAAKYELVGHPIRHVDGQGVMDLSKVNLKTADYLFGIGFKGLKLKTIKPVESEKVHPKAK